MAIVGLSVFLGNVLQLETALMRMSEMMLDQILTLAVGKAKLLLHSVSSRQITAEKLE